MGKRSRASILLLSFWASIVLVAAQIPRGTEHFTLPGTSSNDSCANADCQQGTCVPNDNVLLSLLFPYKCQCSPGWATFQKVVPLLQVPSLPCNVPNCTLNLNCSGDSPAAAPTPSSPLTSANASLCLIPGICGHGTCEEVSGGTITSAIKCVCDPGYSNVLNTTGGYCVNDCEIQGGCLSLNLTLPGTSSNDSCANANCQQGTCVPNDNALVSVLLPYKCQCNPGWATFQKVVPFLQVPSLPCNMPNCTLIFNCSGDLPTAVPTPSSPVTSLKGSLCLVPGICGHGTCEEVSGGTIPSTIKCVCDLGYSNVLNTIGGYCVNDCEIQGECSSLNLTLHSSSSPSPPGPASNQTATNTGCSGISFNRGLYVTTTLAVVWSFLTSCY